MYTWTQLDSYQTARHCGEKVDHSAADSDQSFFSAVILRVLCYMEKCIGEEQGVQPTWIQPLQGGKQTSPEYQEKLKNLYWEIIIEAKHLWSEKKVHN